MPFIDKAIALISGQSGNLITSIGDIIQKYIPSKTDRDAAMAETLKEFNRHDEVVITQLSVLVEAEEKEISERWKSDMASDSWLSKNIRPLVLVALISTLIALIFIDSFHTKFVVQEEWISLMKELLLTVIVAYFGSRGVEKVMGMKNEKDVQINKQNQ